MSDRTIAVCPACDSPDVSHRQGDHASSHRPHADPDWICWACRHEFDDPREREPHKQFGRHGLARELVDADPSEGVADE